MGVLLRPHDTLPCILIRHLQWANFQVISKLHFNVTDLSLYKSWFFMKTHQVMQLKSNVITYGVVKKLQRIFLIAALEWVLQANNWKPKTYQLLGFRFFHRIDSMCTKITQSYIQLIWLGKYYKYTTKKLEFSTRVGTIIDEDETSWSSARH